MHVFRYVKRIKQLSFKINFQNVNQHTRGTKPHKDNQFQSLELSWRI